MCTDLARAEPLGDQMWTAAALVLIVSAATQFQAQALPPGEHAPIFEFSTAFINGKVVSDHSGQSTTTPNRTLVPATFLTRFSETLVPSADHHLLLGACVQAYHVA